MAPRHNWTCSDYKPLLQQMQGQDLPASIRLGQRLTGMTATQTKFPLAGTAFQFNQYGQARVWLSELLPHTARVVDDLCFVKSMFTEAINHDPALTFMQTGAQVGNRPSFGSWMSYGLGSENKNLPAFCVYPVQRQRQRTRRILQSSTITTGSSTPYTRASNSATAKTPSSICPIPTG